MDAEDEMKTGLYELSEEEYHADAIGDIPSLSSSILKIMLDQSPLHARTNHPRLNPNFKRNHDTKFDLGTAAHALLLQGWDNMEVIEADDFRKKEARELRDNAREIGKTPIFARQAEDVREMVDVAHQAIEQCKDFGGRTLKDGYAEQTLVWREDDVLLRGRLDWLAKDFSIYLDYKTTSGSAQPERAARQILNQLHGEVQTSFYCRGITKALREMAPTPVFMVQETEFPYAVSFIGLSPAYIALGDDKVEKGIAMWRECMRSGKWPGYGDRIHYMEPKPWAIDDWVEKSGVNWEYGEQA